jgi:arylsulfatase A-like enzyme
MSTFKFKLTWALGSWLLAAIVGPTFAHAADAAPRPNILLLVADDQRWDTLSCAGHATLETPHIDRLAAEGVRFTHAFVTTSICSISRASILTGRYGRSHGVGDFRTPLPPDLLAQSLPARLKEAGYRTGCLGKWGIGGAEPREVFDTWRAWGGQGEYFETIDGQQVHNSEFLTRWAEEFLRADDGRPWCLLVLYKSPHEPYLPDPQDAALFRDVTFPPPQTGSPAHFDGLPQFIRESEGRRRLLRDCPTPEAFQEFVRQYLRCIAGVDRSVGRIMAVLDELGEAQNTIVVYTSDNGFLLGEHGLSGKLLAYEESIRVPLVVCDPRLPEAVRGTIREELALNIDVAPTLLDLAGLPPGSGADGHSLRPLLEGSSSAWRQDFFYEHHFANQGTIPRTEAVRTGQWKYIRYFDLEPPHEELYDLAADPQETRNLAADAARADLLAELRGRHREYVESLPPAIVGGQ